MSMIRGLPLTGICAATLLFLSVHAFAAASGGAVEASKLEMVIKYVTLKTGQSRTIDVTVSPGKADDKGITWSSSDNSVATVQAAAGTGRATVTAVGEGKAKITAVSHNGKTSVCRITVSDDEVEVRGINMVSQTATLKINQKKLLSVEFSPLNADDKTLVWDSGNREVATVDEDGMVTGISPGVAEITATSGNEKTAVCTVTVTSQALTETGRQAQAKDLPISDNETSISGHVSMATGSERDLSGFVKYKERYKDSNGDWHTQWQLVGQISWASSFPDVVSVNDKGVATARRAGTSRITATGKDETGRKHVQTIVVGVSSGTGVKQENSFEIPEGGRLDLRQIGELHSGTKNIKWSSSIPGIASVDSAGTVQARSIGQCTVTASYTDESNTEQAVKYKLRVTSGMLGNKTKYSAVVLNVGDKIDLGKLYYPNYQDLPNALNPYSCTVGSQEILSADGLTVSAKSAGTASVLVRRTDKTGEAICHKLAVVVKE